MFLFRDSLPKLNGHVRIIHAVPDAPTVDIYLNKSLLFRGIKFGNVTNYINVLPNTYKIEIYPAGTHNKPLITEDFQLATNSVSTIIVTYENNEIAFFTIDDTHADTNPFLSFVRFINVAPMAPLLSLSLPDNRVLFNQTSYLETNNYYPTSSGIYNFIVSSADGDYSKYISNVNLTADMFITIYVIGLYDKNPPLGYILVTDGIKASNK